MVPLTLSTRQLINIKFVYAMDVMHIQILSHFNVADLMYETTRVMCTKRRLVCTNPCFCPRVRKACVRNDTLTRLGPCQYAFYAATENSVPVR